jgi:hypothetical protein
MDPRFSLVERPMAQMMMEARAADGCPAAGEDPAPGPLPVPRTHSRPIHGSAQRGRAVWALRIRASLSRWA